MDNQNSAILPEKYQLLIENLRQELQKETGCLYQFHISRYGDMSGGLTIGDFKSIKQPITITKMAPGYEDLIGSYDSIDDAQKRLTFLLIHEKYEETKTIQYIGKDTMIGKCRMCHSYNENKPGRVPNRVVLDTCQNCTKIYESKWLDVEISRSTPKVIKYSGRAGEYRFYDNIGEYQWQ